MAQNFTADSFGAANQGQSDLQVMENNFEVLRSNFSGASAPSTIVEGTPWFDTAQNILKIRNAADDGWLGVMYGTSSTKVWIYENVARNGWAIDTAVYDCVLALKGGSQAYNANGGTLAGTWTQPNHTLTEAELPPHTHSAPGTHTHNDSVATGSGGSDTAARLTNAWSTPSSVVTSSDGTHTHDSFGGGGAHYHGDTYRPRASLGTLQYPDV